MPLHTRHNGKATILFPNAYYTNLYARFRSDIDPAAAEAATPTPTTNMAVDNESRKPIKNTIVIRTTKPLYAIL